MLTSWAGLYLLEAGKHLRLLAAGGGGVPQGCGAQACVLRGIVYCLVCGAEKNCYCT